MSPFVILVCSFLLAYWFRRTMLLLDGAEEQVEETLDSDFWWGYRIWAGIRTMFLPPDQLFP